ncbi:MAG: hypothetical protein U0228_38195 [Myxococcaceae bacterium]
MRLLELALKLAALAIIAFVLGLVALVAPCYAIGTPEWCGYKSFPKYADLQFLCGAGFGLTAGALALFWRPSRRGP